MLIKKQIKVKPNAKRQTIIEDETGTLTIYLKSPPVDGKANRELIRLLADQFAVPQSHITIRTGAASRLKWVEIELPE